jgi:cell division septum initiation protein DivIVA
MTDYTKKLIERAKEQRDRDAAEHCPAEIIALQDEVIAGLEALQAENERMIQEQSAWRSFTEMANNTVSKAESERDALQSQLDAMGKGEAVATSELEKAVCTVLEGWTIPAPVRKILETAYYAAPKALKGQSA